MTLEDILIIKREEIEKLRKFLFPLIGFNVITGFNIYEKYFKRNTNYLVSYLHSDLDSDKQHYLDLIDKIRKFADVDLIKNIFYEKVDRHTAYKLKLGWKALQYFNIKAEELTEEGAKEIMKRRETVIGIDLQDDMKIQIDDYKDLVNLLNIFMDYANAFVIDKQTGRYKKNLNIKKKDKRILNKEKAITNAWEVPLITVSTNRNKIIPSFYRIEEVSIDNHRFYLSILIDKKFQDLMYLFNQTHFNLSLEKEDEFLFANKVFVDWINKYFYSKNYTDFMKLVKMSLGK